MTDRAGGRDGDAGAGLGPTSPTVQRRRALRRAAAVRSRGASTSLGLTTLVLDLGGVVVPTLFEVLPEHRLPGGPFGGDDRYAEVERGRLQEREYWAELGRARPDLDIAGFMRTRLHIRAEILSLLGALGGRVQIVALTNDMSHWFGPAWAESFPEFAQFDRMLEAARSGVLKPDPAVFRWALSRIGEPAGTCLFVDDLPVNLRGAQAVGMQTQLFDVTDPAGSIGRILDRLGLAAPSGRPRVFRP